MTNLYQEIVRHNQLRDELVRRFPSLEADEDALLGTLEGLSDLKEQIAAVVRSADDDLMLAAGIEQRLAELEERRDRIRARAENKRLAALSAMLDAGEKKIEAPDFTLSVRAGTPSVIVTDEKEVPPEFFVAQEPKLSKSALKDALKAGREVPGAVLSNGAPTLSVRRG